MTISELKNMIENVPDDFEFSVMVEKRVSQEELDKRHWKYPIDTEKCKTERSNFDIGWSDKQCRINIRINEL